MFDKLRENSKIIVYIGVAALVFTGGFMGFGAYMNNNPSGANSQNIAEVNGESISQQEYLNTLQNQASRQPQLSQDRVLSFRLDVLNSMIERRLILQEAEDMGIEANISQEELDKTINNIMEQNNLTEEELKSNLEKQGYNMEQFRADIRNSLRNQQLIQKTIDKTQQDIKVTEAEIKERYKKQNDGKEASGEEFENQKENIRQSIEQEKQSQAFNNWLENIKSEAQIEIFEPSLKGMKALQNEDYDQAVQSFNQIKENSEKVSPSIYMRLAEALNGKGDKEKALETYKESIKEYPENFDLHLSLGQFYNENEEKEKAIVQYDKAAELLSEHDFMGHYRLYQSYQQAGETKKANKEMNKLIEIQNQMKEQQESKSQNTESFEIDRDENNN